MVEKRGSWWIKAIAGGLYFFSLLTCQADEKGELQVEHLFRDRPVLNSIVTKDDEIWTWLVNAFSNNIVWNPNPGNVPSLCNAYHWYNADDGSTEIYVKIISNKTVIESAQETLGLVVFEVFNSQRKDYFMRLRLQAVNGLISRNEYITKIAELEQVACLQEKAFYYNVWVPFATSQGINPVPRYWHGTDSPNFSDWLKKFAGTGYPENLYGPAYDSLAASYGAKSTSSKTPLSSGNN